MLGQKFVKFYCWQNKSILKFLTFSHNLNVRTLFRWIFWLRNQGYFPIFTVHTLMMACCGSIKSLSYLRTPLCKYVPIVPSTYLCKLPKCQYLHYKRLTRLTPSPCLTRILLYLRFKKRSFISLSLVQVKSCIIKTST